MGNNKKDPNQKSSFPPNSIGGRLDELMREKLIKLQTKPNEKTSETGLCGKGKAKRNEKESDGARTSKDS